MKKIFFIFTIALLFSCSDSVEIPTSNVSTSDIEGVWNLTSLTSEVNTKVTSLDSSYENESITTHGEEYNFSFNFSQNPNVYTTEGTLNVVTETVINDETETTKHEANTVQGLSTGEWKVSGKNLIFKKGDNGAIQSKFTIEWFSKNKMVLKRNLSENKVKNNSFIVVTGASTIILER
ncbi:Lipocalin-like domain-containing protein [Tenacibaculum sediminilitoris]|uniref:hypothetical protein n=1 Tax=Tenacibaculum sediminilitoris TaxID=1820334 RepID=UPI0038939BE8